MARRSKGRIVIDHLSATACKTKSLTHSRTTLRQTDSNRSTNAHNHVVVAIVNVGLGDNINQNSTRLELGNCEGDDSVGGCGPAVAQHR